MKRGDVLITYISYDKHPNFFRMVISNQAADYQDLDYVIKAIKEVGELITIKSSLLIST